MVLRGSSAPASSLLPASVSPLPPCGGSSVLFPKQKCGYAAPWVNLPMVPHGPQHHFLAWPLPLQHHVGTVPSETLPMVLLSHVELPCVPIALHMLPVPGVPPPSSTRWKTLLILQVSLSLPLEGDTASINVHKLQYSLLEGQALWVTRWLEK